MAERVVLSRPAEGVALLTLDTAEIGGFVSWEAVDALAEKLGEARNGGARVAVLASAFDGHWFEHAWLRDLCNMVEGRETSSAGAGWFQALEELTSPHLVTIAAVSGDCSGGGAELGWACDLRVAEEQATFAQPEVLLGIPTGIGGTARLARLVGRTVAAEMVLDGAPVPARRVYDLGGVNRIVPRGKAVEVSVEWATRLATRPPAAIAALKEVLNHSEDQTMTDALANEQAVFQRVAGTPEALERMKAAQARFDAGEPIRDVYGRGVS